MALPFTIGGHNILVYIALAAAIAFAFYERMKRVRRDYFHAASSALETICSGTPATAHTYTSAKDASPVQREGAGDGAAMRVWLASLRPRAPREILTLWESLRAAANVLPFSTSAPEILGARLVGSASGASGHGPAVGAAPAAVGSAKHYHEAVHNCFMALRPLWAGSMRLFHEHHLFNRAYRPDFVFAPIKEATATGTNTLVFVEVKTVAVRRQGLVQLQRYICTQLKQHVTSMLGSQATAADLATLQGVGLVTTAYDVLLMRVSLRLMPPAAGGEAGCAVVTDMSGWLPFLSPRSAQPTEGFAAVCTLLAAPPQLLGRTRPVPDYVPLPAGTSSVPVLLHLGAGGFSDVYSVRLPDGTNAALKRPHHDNALRRADLVGERRALALLPPGVPQLPQLVHGLNDTQAPPVSLVSRPVGSPLDDEAEAAIAAAYSSGAEPAASVRQLAADVYRAVLAALRAAHGAGVVHGDVRRPNVVAHGGTYVLVDWGHVRVHGPPAALVGLARDKFERARASDLRSACRVYLELTGPLTGAPGDDGCAQHPTSVTADDGKPAIETYSGWTAALSQYYYTVLGTHPMEDAVAYSPPL